MRIGWLSVWPVISTVPGVAFSASAMRASSGRVRSAITGAARLEEAVALDDDDRAVGQVAHLHQALLDLAASGRSRAEARRAGGGGGGGAAVTAGALASRPCSVAKTVSEALFSDQRQAEVRAEQQQAGERRRPPTSAGRRAAAPPWPARPPSAARASCRRRPRCRRAASATGARAGCRAAPCRRRGRGSGPRSRSASATYISSSRLRLAGTFSASLRHQLEHLLAAPGLVVEQHQQALPRPDARAAPGRARRRLVEQRAQDVARGDHLLVRQALGAGLRSNLRMPSASASFRPAGIRMLDHRADARRRSSAAARPPRPAG